MKSILVSAPGKAVLSGEYAVLRKAPAISLALNCRAVARAEVTSNAYHSIQTPGHADGQWRFTTNEAGEISWLDEIPDKGLRLIEEAWRACMPGSRRHISTTLDTQEFFAPGSGRKLGLGGSAAAMTALVGALTGLEQRFQDTRTLAAIAHKAFQNGRGSGVDIATSFCGGVIEFRMDRDGPPLQLAWPDGLCYHLLWSGHPADTTSKIDRLESARDSNNGWAPLVAAAEDTAAAWKRSDAAEVVEFFDRYTDVLYQFSIDHDLGIFDAGHDRLKDLAASFGVVYKPCGAGGGDIGIVLATDETAISRFCDRAVTSGFRRLEVSRDASGVRSSPGDGK